MMGDDNRCTLSKSVQRTASTVGSIAIDKKQIHTVRSSTHFLTRIHRKKGYCVQHRLLRLMQQSNKYPILYVVDFFETVIFCHHPACTRNWC